MTLLDLLTEALQTCQIVGDAQPVPDYMAQIAQKALVGLVDTANADPLKKFTRPASLYTLQPGKQAYTIGPDPSMDFNAPTPQNIVAANCVDLSAPTYPVRVPMDVLDYRGWAAIGLQNAPTPIPRKIYYDEGYTPIGTTTQGYATIRVHGVPTVANQIELYTEAALTQASAYTDLIIVPPAYYEWMLYGLCIRLYPRFGRPVDPTVLELGRDAMLKLESANVVTPVLQLDSGLPNGRSSYFDARTNRYI